MMNLIPATMTYNDTSDRAHLFSSGEDKITVVQPYDMRDYDQQINEYYQTATKQPSDHLKLAATFFLDQPYLFEPVGEGEHAEFSQEPLYRTDKFDCVSYVNTVLALIHAKHLQQFKEKILSIRYANAQVNYTHRTDWFTDLEWLPNARQLGWLKDITEKIVDDNHQPIALATETLIDKPNWYKVKPFKVMHLLEPLPTSQEADNLIRSLRAKAELFKAQSSRLTYLPLNKLFNANGSENDYLLQQIPSGSVIVIVRPDWQIRDNFPGFPNGYGTNLNVSHLGLTIRTQQGLMFYHASSIHRKVEFLPLTDYLKQYLDSPTIKGIHVEQII